MFIIKQSATITVNMGPAVDKTDGVTAETALSPTVNLSKNGGTFAARNSATAIAHDQSGWYKVELNATDTDTLGRLVAEFHADATHLPVWCEFEVVPANVYDAMVGGSDKLQVDTVELTGTAQTARDLGANIDASVSSRATPAQVNAEVLDVVNVDLFSKPGQETPGDTMTLVKAVMFILKRFMNRHDFNKSTGVGKLYGNDGTTVDQKYSVTDDGTTTDVGEVATGP